VNKRPHNLGDAPIEERFFIQMQAIAGVLDESFNPGAARGQRETGFILLVLPFGGPKGQRCNYVSNADRRDVITMLKEQLAYFEGMPQGEGHG
jgi:hypothetical protein